MFQQIGEVPLDLATDVMNQIQLHTESMRRILHALETAAPPQGRIRREAVTPPMEMSPIEEVSIDWLKQQQIHSTFQSIMRSVIDFMDLVLGVEVLVSQPQVVSRDIVSVADFATYLKEKFATEAVGIGQKRNLTNPKKVRAIGGLSPSMEASLLGMIEARRIIEHHKAVVEHDFDFVTLEIRLVIDSEKVSDFPVLVREGQQVGYEIVERVQTFKVGERIALAELDIDEVLLTLTQHIIPMQIEALNGKGWMPDPEPKLTSSEDFDGGVTDAH